MDEIKTVNVFNPYGQPENIPHDQLPDALKFGYQIAEPEAVNAWKMEQEYGPGMGNTLKAFGAGAARAATFGISDQLLTKSGITSPEALSALKEHHGPATVGGEIAGIGASFLAPGLTPVGLLAKGATSAAKAIIPAAAEAAPLAARILSSTGTGALGSAIEGAAYGLGQSVSEEALGDPDLNGEKLISNIGLSALIGGGLGGALGFGAQALPPAFSKAKGAITSLKEKFLPAAENEVGALGQAYAKASSFVSGKPYDEIIEAIKNRKFASTTPEETAVLTRDFNNSLSDHFSSMNTVLKDAHTFSRPRETKGLLTNVPPGYIKEGVPFETHVGVVKRLNEVASEMRKDPDLYSATFAREAEKIAEGQGRRTSIDSTPDEIFESLNQIKKTLDDKIPFGKDPFMMTQAEKNSVSLIKGIRGDIKNVLEDANIWGPAAARQAAFNNAESQYLRLVGNRGLFKKYFLEDRLGKDGRLEKAISPAKVKTFFSQLGTANGEEKARVLGEFLEKSEGMLGEATKSYETMASSPVWKGKAAKSLQDTHAVQSKAMEQVEYNKLLNRLGAGGHNTYLGEGVAIVSGMHNPVLGAAVEAFNLFRNPGLTVQRLEQIEKSINKTTQLLESGTKAIFKATSTPAKRLPGYLGAKLIPDTKKTNDLIAQINSMGNNPDLLVEHLDRSTSDLYDVAPNTSQFAQSTTARAIQFLASKTPVRQTSEPLSLPQPASKAELDKFGRYLSVVNDPFMVLQQVRDGTLTSESMETMQMVYPKLYQEMKGSVMMHLMGDGSQTKMKIPYKLRLSLSTFMEQDLDGSLAPKAMLINQMALNSGGLEGQENMNAQKPTQKGLDKLDMGASLMTPQQKSAHRAEV